MHRHHSLIVRILRRAFHRELNTELRSDGADRDTISLLSTRIEIRPSLKLIKAAYVGCVALAAGVAVWGLMQPPFAGWLWLFVLPGLLMVWCAARHVRKAFTRMILDGDKLRFESGMLSKTLRTLQVSKIQDVRVDQSLGQRMLGTGTLTVETAGETGLLRIEGIDRPREAADALLGTKNG